MENELKELLNNAYAPYSNFRVSAIVVMNDGNKFGGVNVENASYGSAICAEKNAITTSITSGYKKGDFKEIHVMCGDSKTYSMPCFSCRQLLVEFFDKDCFVFVYNSAGDYKKYKISDICPYPFDSEDLK